MRMQWRKLVVIMLMGLLVAGPFALIHNAVASPESEKAKVANEQAAKALHDTMMQMDSMSKMPMTANEKAMMKTIHDLAVIVQMLINSNKNLIDAVEHGVMKQ